MNVILCGPKISIFTVYATIFGEFMAAFHFSYYIGEIDDHFTLELLKKFDT